MKYIGDAKRRHPSSGLVSGCAQGSSSVAEEAPPSGPVDATRRALNARQSVSTPARGRVSGTIEEGGSLGRSLSSSEALVMMARRGQRACEIGGNLRILCDLKYSAE